MNPLIAHRVHVAGIGALMALTLVGVYFQLGMEYPSGFTAYRWFGIVNSVIVAALLGVRLRQVIAQAIAVSPRPGIETIAVAAGQILIALGFVGTLTSLVLNFAGGSSTISLMSSAATAGFWIGLACIELVIANGRSAVLPPGERPSGTARVLVGVLLLFAGFVLGIMAVFGFFFVSLGH